VVGTLARLLLLEERGADAFVTRFQQTTPPVVAKGVEDTAFYRYGRLLALNDVGGNPGRFGMPVEDFHAANAIRAERFPNNLLVTQTHDTKRSGDVRARIGALAAMPDAWAERLRTWLRLTRSLVRHGAPDDTERSFVFQTLVGAWPLEQQRLGAYMEKALREAKRTTNWVEPDESWEARVQEFCAGLYSHREFLADFEPFAQDVARVGERMALGQLLLKLTVPGIPDIYQGDELLSLSLVDPDNRRAVDWDARRAALAEVAGGAAPARENVKLWVITRALDLRRRRPEAFAGGYEPLPAGATVCAFVRGGEVVAATATYVHDRAATVPLPPGRWRDVLDGGREAERSAPLGDLGIALLESAA
jgi:(1->4)-alpha-D-glucan 1-alpha-D-glucosylmutase